MRFETWRIDLKLTIFLYILCIIPSIAFAEMANLYNPNLKNEDEAITRLSDLNKYFRKMKTSRIYFNSAYLTVTQNLDKKIKTKGYFQYPNCISAMITKFSNKYLDALNKNITHTAAEPWNVHFEANVKPSTMLMLGMNAHISYDLPISLFEITKEMPTKCNAKLIKQDYFKLNHFFHDLIPLLNQDLKREANYIATIDAGDDLIFPIVYGTVILMRQNAWMLYNELLANKIDIETIEFRAKIESRTIELTNYVMPPAGY